MTRLAVIALGFILALDVLNLDKAVASMLAGVGILGIAFGFASQDIAANFMAGIVLHFIHPFRLGDRQILHAAIFLVGNVEIMDYAIPLKCATSKAREITIPNKNILGNPIINFYHYRRPSGGFVLGPRPRWRISNRLKNWR